jgi:hypothetical protein
MKRAHVADSRALTTEEKAEYRQRWGDPGFTDDWVVKSSMGYSFIAENEEECMKLFNVYHRGHK